MSENGEAGFFLFLGGGIVYVVLFATIMLGVWEHRPERHCLEDEVYTWTLNYPEGVEWGCIAIDDLYFERFPEYAN